MGYNLRAVPRLGNVDCAPIGTHVIVLYGHLGRVVLEMAAPSKTDVHILWVAKAVEFPYGWSAKGVPIGVVKVGKIEISRTLVGISHPTETPITIYRQIAP